VEELHGDAEVVLNARYRAPWWVMGAGEGMLGLRKGGSCGE